MFGIQWLPRGMSFIKSAHLPAIHIERMQSDYPDIRENPLMSRAIPLMTPHRVLRVEDILPLPEFETTEYHKETVAPMGGLIADYIVANKMLPTRLTALILARRPGEASADRRTVENLQAISPHIGHAFEVMLRLGHLTAQYDSLDQVLCRLQLAIGLVDDTGALIFANPAMERVLERDDRVHLRDGRLVPREQRADRELAALLKRAMADPPVESDTNHVRIHGDDEPPYSITVQAMNTDQATSLGLGHARAVVFITDFGLVQSDLLNSLARHFRLSAKQTEVLRRITIGMSGPEIASELGISENTLKTHMVRLFEKTGAKSRDDLFRLFISRAAQSPFSPS